MPKDTGWRPDYDNMKDILRPYDEKEDSAPQPDAPAVPEGERDWRAKLAEEDRQQHRTEARSRRRIWPGLSMRRRPDSHKENKRRKKRGAALARTYRLHVAAQIAPFAVILLLAPFISGPGGFYLLALLLAAPLTAAALLLRPLGKRAWLLRALIPMLPVEAWFALRYFSWNPGTALLLVSLFALGGALYYIFGVRGKGPDKDAPRPETRSAQLELEVRGRQQARRTRSDDERQAAMGHSRRLLLFAVPVMCTALLMPALLGLGLQLRRPQAAAATDLERQRDEAYIAQRMTEAYTDMQPGVWESLSRADREKALQALLNVEMDFLEMPYYYELRDPVVRSLDVGKSGASIAALLSSGKEKTEERVRAVCHLAYHLRQLVVSKEGDGDLRLMRPFEEDARSYEDARYIRYAAIWKGEGHAR